MFNRFLIYIIQITLILCGYKNIYSTNFIKNNSLQKNDYLLKIDKVWPIHTDKVFTSNFMEDRPGRFHAGLDLRTFGKKLPIYAIEDGYISRINISPWGYGRALYLKGKSGKTYVYGHTDRFIKKIEDVVLEKQYKKKRYRVNFYPKKSRLRVKQGQLIGYSGNTGIGPNHLHFEIRDINNAPINPELIGYTINDTIKPVFKKVVFTPLTDSSTINGQLNIKSYNLSELKDDTIKFNGKIGLSIVAYDKKSNNKRNKIAIYEYLLTSGNDTLFFQQNRGFSYSDDKYAYKDRNYSYPKKYGVRAKNLFRTMSNNAKFYKWAKKGDGILCSNKMNGVKNLKIELFDVLGNSSGISFFIKKQPKTYIPYNPYFQYKSGSEIKIDRSTLNLNYTPYKMSAIKTKSFKISFLHNSLRVISKKNPYTMYVKNGKGIFKLQKDKRAYYLPYYNLEGGLNEFYFIDKTVFGYQISNIASQYFYKLTPDTSYEISLNKNQKLKIKKNSVKKRETYFVIEKKNINLAIDGFRKNKEYKSFKIIGQGRYLLKSIKEIYKPTNKILSSMQLYSKLGREFRYQLGNLKDSLIFNHQFGTIYAVLDDTKAPRITKINGGRSISIEENGSGIGSDKQIKTTLNGKFILNRYDPEARTTKVIFSEKQKIGTLIYRVKDRVGNMSVLKVEIK